MVPHHAVLRRQSARLCLDLHAAGLAWVGAQAAASAERWRARWRANLSAQVCEDAAERVMQAGSAGAACAAQAQLRLALRLPPLRESEQACMRRAGTLPARVALPPCLVPYWAAPAGVLLGGMALRACGGGAWRVAGFRLCQHALWVLRGRPRSPTPVWRAPRHLCKSSSLAVFKYQSMPQKCRDIGDPQSCRETEGVPSAHLAVRWLFYKRTTIPAAPRARSSCCYGICRSLTLLLHRRWRQPARERGPDSNTWPGTARADASASGLWIRPPSYCASS